MNSSVSTASELKWSIVSSEGIVQSTTLPSVVRTFEDFAKVDVYTGDIDPAYFAIGAARSNFGHGWATRFAVAMLCYYHTGTAAEAADYEGEDFWSFISNRYDTAPRAAERRHWRGEQGKRSLTSMYNWSPNPDKWFEKFGTTYQQVKINCERNLKGFGPYFVLKICDYMDRCLGYPFDPTYAGLAFNLPTLPAQAAELLYPGYSAPDAFYQACERLKPLGLLAPPLFDRPLGPAEVETILCDWKRAKYGNHIIGDDVIDKRQSLVGYGQRAEKMIEFFPNEFPLNTFRCNWS